MTLPWNSSLRLPPARHGLQEMKRFNAMVEMKIMKGLGGAVEFSAFQFFFGGLVWSSLYTCELCTVKEYVSALKIA